jgi:hypothetical protein
MKKLLLSVAILFVATYWLAQDNGSSDVNERVNGNDFAELVNNTETVSLN